MNATLRLSYSQILELVMQLPVHAQMRLGKALTRNATEKELRHLLDTFRNDELLESEIMVEVKNARHRRYNSEGR